MKFYIYRESDWLYKEKPPCAGAKLERLEDEEGDVRNFWYIEINTLEELLALEEEVRSDLILGHACEEQIEGQWQLNIIDDWLAKDCFKAGAEWMAEQTKKKK